MTTEKEIKKLNFFLVLCKTKKKIEKYIKTNKIRNKYIIDIKKWMDEESLTPEDAVNSDLFKILILKKFNLAIEKKKDIYYIPYITPQNIDTTKNLFNIKDLLYDSHNFNLLYFYEDFEMNNKPKDILDNIDKFDLSQLIKDY